MNDNNDQANKGKTEKKDINGKQVQVRYIPINGKEISVVKLGEIADVKVGLQTGDNKAYLYQNPQARGNYRSIEDYKEFVLTEKDLEKIRNNEELRLAVIDKGISKNNKNNRYFGGRYIVPYDKGGASDADGGWLPNYHVPTDYFIDWSEWAVHRMKTLTIKEKDGKGSDKICSRFQNSDTYFYHGLTLSYTGMYAPNLRFKVATVYDVGGSSMFPLYDIYQYIGIFNTKIIKYYSKNTIDHTVNFQIDEVKALPYIIIQEEINHNIKYFVEKIIIKQKQYPRYDYASHEQIEIDRLVYEAYGLNEDDIQEVENWYVRRYPKLAAAQKANLEAKQKAETK